MYIEIVNIWPTSGEGIKLTLTIILLIIYKYHLTVP